MPNLKDPEWLERANKLKKIIAGINANGGTINCGHVAIRVDDHLAANKNLNRF